MPDPSKLDYRAADAPVSTKVKSAPVIPKLLDQQLSNPGTPKPEKSLVNTAVNGKRKSKIKLDSDDSSDEDDIPLV